MKQKKIIWILSIIVIVLIGIKFIPYAISEVPLGYDPGFYKSFFDSYFAATPVFDYNNIDSWIKRMYEPLLGHFSIVLQMIGYGVDFLLSYGLAIFSGITSLFVYIVLKKYDKKCAWIGMILILISIIQYQTFWWCYYKQILGVIFILTTIYLLQKGKYILILPTLIAAFTVQRPTGVFLLGTMTIYMLGKAIFEKKIDKKLILLIGLAGIGAIILYRPLLDSIIIPLIKPLMNKIFIEGSSGTFFTTKQYISYSWPTLILAIIAIILKFKEKKTIDIIDSGFIFGIIWVGLKLFFYNRMLIFLDVFAVLLAAWTLRYLLSKKWGYYVLGIFLIGQTIWYGTYIKERHIALAAKSEINFLSNIKYMIPQDSLIIVTSSNYTPWAIGYSQMKTMAPGLLDRDPWTKEQWFERRKGDGKFKCDRFNQSKMQKNNIFMFIGKYQNKENLNNGSCFKLIYRKDGYYLFSVNLDQNAK